MRTKSAVFWLLGSFCLFFGVLITSSADPAALGNNPGTVSIALIMGFVLILIAGMLWISTAHID